MLKHQLKETVLRNGKRVTNNIQRQEQNDQCNDDDLKFLGEEGEDDMVNLVSPKSSTNIISQNQEMFYQSEESQNVKHQIIIDTSDKIIRDFLFRVMLSAQKTL